MTKKIADLSDFMGLLKDVANDKDIKVEVDGLDPDILLLCFSIYTEGYNSAMRFVDDCLDRMAGRMEGGEK